MEENLLPALPSAERALIMLELQAPNPGVRAAVRYGRNVRSTTVQALKIFGLGRVANQLNTKW